MSTASSTASSGRTLRRRLWEAQPISPCCVCCPMSWGCPVARFGSWPARPVARSWSSSTASSLRSSLPAIRACGYDRGVAPGTLSGAAVSRAIGSVVRARGSHPRGHWFESSIAHHRDPNRSRARRPCFCVRPARMFEDVRPRTTTGRPPSSAIRERSTLRSDQAAGDQEDGTGEEDVHASARHGSAEPPGWILGCSGTSGRRGSAIQQGRRRPPPPATCARGSRSSSRGYP